MFQCDCPPDDCADKVARHLRGDRAAGDALARKFTPLVLSVVARVLGPAQRGEWDDACQAVFLRLFANLERWERRCPFCKWLAVVAARRAIDLSHLPDARERLPLFDVADDRPAPPDPETIERIAQIVAGFSPAWRQVWEWFVQGVRRDEMATRAGKSPRTIQYWLAEMLDLIRERLEE